MRLFKFIFIISGIAIYALSCTQEKDELLECDPTYSHFKYIYDDNDDKFNKKFITMKPTIVSSKKINLNEPIIITSISSKMATRSIFTNLKKIGAKKIIVPRLSV